jgi:hypothetical protein
MLPNPLATERREQFIMEHGGRDNTVSVGNGWLLFSDGATMEQSYYGCLKEPPDSAYERAKLHVRYRQILLQRAVQAFDELKGQLRQHADYCARHGHPPPSQAELDKLKELQRIVRSREKDLAQAIQVMEQNIPESLRRRDAIRASNKEQSERVLSALDEIQV